MNIDVRYDVKYPDVQSGESLSVHHSHAQTNDLIQRIQSMNLKEVLEQMSLLYADIKLFKNELERGLKENHWCALQKEVCIDKQLYQLLKDKLNILKTQLLSKPLSLHEVTEFEHVVPSGHTAVLNPVEDSFRVFSPCNFEKVKHDLQQFENKVKIEGDGSSPDEIDLPLASNTETPADSP